jgi:hypothetical protein
LRAQLAGVIAEEFADDEEGLSSYLQFFSGCIGILRNELACTHCSTPRLRLCFYAEVVQDIFHAQDRVVKHLAKKHPEYAKARRSLKVVFRRLFTSGPEGVESLTL